MIAVAAGAIGKAVARRLADEGAVVVGIDRREHDVGVLSPIADLGIAPEVRDVFARIHHETGRIDVIYNNAGLVDPADGSALDTTIETWNRIFAANLTTAWLSCKHGIPYLLGNDPMGGSVINTASFLAGMAAASAHMPMGRFGSLDELAGTVAYPASDDAGFVTGSVFPINGGIPGAFTVPE